MLPARSSVSCVPGAGRTVWSRSLESTISAEPAAGRDDHVLGLHVEVDPVERARRHRLGRRSRSLRFSGSIQPRVRIVPLPVVRAG